MSAPKELKDLYFGEALYNAFQGDWFDAIARLDAELTQHYGVDEPERDTLYYHINHAEFAVGDFELAYRMHQRAIEISQGLQLRCTLPTARGQKSIKMKTVSHQPGGTERRDRTVCTRDR